MNLFEDDSDAAELRQTQSYTGAARVHALREEPSTGAVFKWLDPRDPSKARRRLGRLYWNGWTRIVMSFFLLAFGITFLVIGLLCMYYCTDFDRGVAFFFIGLLLFMPGTYGACTLLFYLRGVRGYSYKDLPDMN